MSKIGVMRERVTIQTFTETDDGAGGCVATWSDYTTVWARVQPVRGQETTDAGRLASLQTYLVTIRYRTDFDTTARLHVVSGPVAGKYLNIRSRENRDERRTFLTMECQEGVQNG